MTDLAHRKKFLEQLEARRGSKAILYVTGDRKGFEARIGQDVLDLFVDHLDAIGPVPKISLVLYTAGGDTAAAWNLVNLIQMFCDDFEVIAPSKCRSAGTLICLGANRIVMTKQATLGPIDPAIQHPLGPTIPNASGDARVPVSVEAVTGYLDAVARDGDEARAQALVSLAQQIHPLVLGQVFRSRQQIRELAKRLLHRQEADEESVTRIIDFLGSDSGSHDYTINRREADRLGLKVEKCSAPLYEIMKGISASYTSQLELRSPASLASMLRPRAQKIQELSGGKPMHYTHTHVIVESMYHNAHHFVSEGLLEVSAVGDRWNVKDVRHYDGWRQMK